MMPYAVAKTTCVRVPDGTIVRACRGCEVTWCGARGDSCWCCGTLGIDGPLRLFVVRNR